MSKPVTLSSAKNKPKQSWIFLSDKQAYVVLALICFMCYGPTLFNGYSLDDDLNVTNNAYVQKGIAGIPDILTHPYAAWANKGGDYRPMAAITYAIEKQLFGDNPHISHFVNIVLYTFCICFLFVVLTQVFLLQKLHPLLPLVIAGLFAAHPAHTEVVCSIKNREEILSLMFALPALLYAHRFFVSENKIQFAVIAILFLFLSFVSKVTSLPMIGVMLLWGFYQRKPKSNAGYLIFIGVVIVLALCYFGWIWHGVKREFYDLENPLVFNNDPSVKLGTVMETLFFYFRFMFFPHPLSFYYGFNTLPLVAFNNPLSFVSLVIHLSLLIYGVRLFFQRKIAGFFILCYFLCIFPYSNLAVIYTGIVSERAFFFPGLWLLSAFVVLVFSVAKFEPSKPGLNIFQKAVIAIGLIFFVGFTWLTIQRDFQWRSTYSLLTADVEHLQNSTLANFFYGSLLQETGEKMADTTRNNYLEKAKKYYRQALSVSPGYSEPYYKLGMIYEYDQQMNDTAFNYFKKANQLDTALSPAKFQLAKLYLFRGGYKEANPLFESVYRKIPTDTFNLFFYAQGLFFGGDAPDAFKINDKLLAVAPGYYQPYLNRGMFNKATGNMQAALPDLERAAQLGCTDPILFNTLLNGYLETGQTDKANQLQKFWHR